MIPSPVLSTSRWDRKGRQRASLSLKRFDSLGLNLRTLLVHTAEPLANVLFLYTWMGFPGDVGSTDCVPFYSDQCPHNVLHLYLGKEGKPTDWNRMNGEQIAMLLLYQHLRHLSQHFSHLLCPQWPANKACTTVCWVCFYLSLASCCQIQLWCIQKKNLMSFSRTCALPLLSWATSWEL